MELDSALLEELIIPKLDTNNLEHCLLVFDLYAHIDNLNVKHTSSLREGFNNKNCRNLRIVGR